MSAQHPTIADEWTAREWAQYRQDCLAAIAREKGPATVLHRCVAMADARLDRLAS